LGGEFNSALIFWFFCSSPEPAEGSRQKNKDVFGLHESADTLIKLLELHKYLFTNIKTGIG